MQEYYENLLDAAFIPSKCLVTVLEVEKMLCQYKKPSDQFVGFAQVGEPN